MDQLVLAALLAALQRAPAPAAPPVNEAVVREIAMLNPSVRIEAGSARGSGTVLYSGERGTYVITNEHVVSASQRAASKLGADRDSAAVQVRVWQVNAAGKTVLSVLRDAVVVASDSDEDLALLRLEDDELRLPAAKLAPADATIYAGETVFAAGAALSHRPHLTTGLVSIAAEHGSDGHTLIMTSAPIVYGNSGGSLWRVVGGDYEMIGVPEAVAMVRISGAAAAKGSAGPARAPLPSMGFAIPLERVRAFLAAKHFAFVAE